MTTLVGVLRRHRGLLTIAGLAVSIVFGVLNVVDFLDLIHHGGAHISSAVKAPFGLAMMIVLVLVLVVAIADITDEKRAKLHPRLDG